MRPLPEKSESRPGCQFSAEICFTRDVKEAEATETKEGEAKETEPKEEMKGEEDTKDMKDDKEKENENEEKMEKDEHDDKEKEVKAGGERCRQRRWFVELRSYNRN